MDKKITLNELIKEQLEEINKEQKKNYAPSINLSVLLGNKKPIKKKRKGRKCRKV